MTSPRYPYLLRFLFQVLGFSLWICIVPTHLFAQSEQTKDNPIIERLKKQGFENLSYTESAKEITLSIEPGIWKSFSEGSHAALEELERVLKEPQFTLSNVSKPLRIVFLHEGIPMYAYLKDSLTAPTWKPTYDNGESWTIAKRSKRMNNSYNKLDIVLYSQYAMRNQRIDVMAEYYLSLSPCLEWNPWKGMHMYAQVIIPIINEFGYEYQQIRQGNISAHQSFRVGNTFGEASVGCFSKNRWGFDLNLYRPLASQGFWSDARIVGNIGYTGSSSFHDWYWHVGPVKKLTWSIGGNFFYRKIDTRFDLRLERYLAEDIGIRAEAIRYFKRATIGLYTIKNKEGGLDGGFTVAFQIPTYKQKRWGNFFRITPSTTLDYEYTGAAFFYLDKKYSTFPGDNNAFTRYFSPSR